MQHHLLQGHYYYYYYLVIGPGSGSTRLPIGGSAIRIVFVATRVNVGGSTHQLIRQLTCRLAHHLVQLVQFKFFIRIY